MFFEGRLHSIEFDRMLIRSELQDQCQLNIQRFDVSSMHCANFVHDVVHPSHSFQDLYALSLWSQQARGKPSVFCLNSNLQVSIHC